MSGPTLPDAQAQDEARTLELARGLSAVRDRIAAACDAVGRDPALVTLIVVTKFFPAPDLARLLRLGVTDIGENRDQEAAAKLDQLRALVPQTLPRVHFIGQLQTNKATSVARYADVVHSVDRQRLVRALERGAQAAQRTLEVLIQVNLDEQQDVGDSGSGAARTGPGRGGVAPWELPEVAGVVEECPSLRLRGLMGVAPLGGQADRAFERLATLSRQLQGEHPGADVISAGMSGDLEAAVAAGATHLRVGSAILGSRPPHG